MSTLFTRYVWDLDCTAQPSTATRPFTSRHKLVLLAIAELADDRGQCLPGTKKLRQMTGLARETILRTVGELEDRGHLYVEQGGAGGVEPNLYRILQITGDEELPGDHLSPVIVSQSSPPPTVLSPPPTVLATSFSLEKEVAADSPTVVEKEEGPSGAAASLREGEEGGQAVGRRSFVLSRVPPAHSVRTADGLSREGPLSPQPPSLTASRLTRSPPTALAKTEAEAVLWQHFDGLCGVLTDEASVQWQSIRLKCCRTCVERAISLEELSSAAHSLGMQAGRGAGEQALINEVLLMRGQPVAKPGRVDTIQSGVALLRSARTHASN